MGGKTEKDLLGVASMLGDLLGIGGVSEAIEKATGGKIPKGAGAGKETPGDGKTLEQCPKCKVFVLGSEHACGVEARAAETSPAPKSNDEPDAGPHFYCAFDGAGKFIGAFVSPYQACEAAGGEGYTKRLAANKIPTGEE